MSLSSVEEVLQNALQSSAAVLGLVAVDKVVVGETRITDSDEGGEVSLPVVTIQQQALVSNIRTNESLDVETASIRIRSRAEDRLTARRIDEAIYDALRKYGATYDRGTILDCRRQGRIETQEIDGAWTASSVYRVIYTVSP